VKINAKCLICARIDKDGGHLYFKCKAVKQVWRELGLETERVQMAEIQSAEEVVDSILPAAGRKSLSWQQCCGRGGIQIYVNEVMKWIVRQSKIQRKRNQWSARPQELLKLNCDASYARDFIW
jgi:hypothetical protein